MTTDRKGKNETRERHRRLIMWWVQLIRHLKAARTAALVLTAEAADMPTGEFLGGDYDDELAELANQQGPGISWTADMAASWLRCNVPFGREADRLHGGSILKAVDPAVYARIRRRERRRAAATAPA